MIAHLTVIEVAIGLHVTRGLLSPVWRDGQCEAGTVLRIASPPLRVRGQLARRLLLCSVQAVPPVRTHDLVRELGHSGGRW